MGLLSRHFACAASLGQTALLRAQELLLALILLEDDILDALSLANILDIDIDSLGERWRNDV